MNWTYEENDVLSIDNIPENTFGFIYKITHIPSKKAYIGKKFLTFTRKQKLGKKELKLLEGGKGRPASFKVVQKESDWKTYWSSNKPLKDLVKKEPKENFKREIICLCESRGDTNYMEAKIQFDEEVLLNPENYNGIIAIKLGYGSVKNLSEKYVQSKQNML